MKRVTLRWIIGLMGFAMIGLIGFQLYWINRLVNANEERFQKDVLEALNGVADKLERQETIEAYQKLNYHLANNPAYDTSIRNRPLVQYEQSLLTPNNPKMELVERGNQQVVVFADTMSNGSFEMVVNFSSTATNFFQPFPQKPPPNDQLLATEIRIKELED